MSKNLPAKFVESKTPHLPESLRRLLADSFRLEGETEDPWIAPKVPPETASLRAARQELERGLKPGTPGHMQWCVRKMFSLPSRKGDAEDAAFLGEAFIDACAEYPDDLWTAGTTEILKTKTFRPSPAEFVAVVEQKFLERQRMLERVKLMLNGTPPPKPAIVHKPRFDPRPADMLHRHSLISRRRVGMFGPMPSDLDAWWYQIRQAAAEEQLDVGRLEDWKSPPSPQRNGA